MPKNQSTESPKYNIYCFDIIYSNKLNGNSSEQIRNVACAIYRLFAVWYNYTAESGVGGITGAVHDIGYFISVCKCFAL